MNISRFKSIFLLIIGGLLCASSFAPFDFIIGAMVGIVPLLFIENSIAKSEGTKKWRVFLSAYLFFAVFNFGTIWWVSNAAWVAVIASVVVNSFFFSILFLAYHLVKARIGEKAGMIGLVSLWIGWEYIELIDWDLSWPWLTIGHSLANWPKLIQWYSYTGVLGGSFWLLLINIQVYRIVLTKLSNQESYFVFRRSLKVVYTVLIPSIFSLVMFYNYSEQGETATVVVAQPNMDPYQQDRFIDEKGNRKFRSNNLAHFNQMLKQIEDSVDLEVDFLLFPETAIPRTFTNYDFENSDELRLLKDWKSDYPNLNVVTGIAYREFKEGINDSVELPVTYKRISGTNNYFEYFNSSIILNSSDSITQYHKSRLVIGVERIPSYFIFLQKYLEDFDENPDASIYNPNNAVQADREVFVSGDKTMKMAPIICYESIFGEYVTEYVQKGANFLGIITNDAWWGDTPGHQQHWSFAKLRAIETRRAVARSANTGWSGFINQRGEEISRSQYLQPAVLKGNIQLNSELTFYVKYGDYIGRFAAGLGLLVLLNLMVNIMKGETSIV